VVIFQIHVANLALGKVNPKCQPPIGGNAQAPSRHWTATAGFVVTQDFFTYIAWPRK